MKTVDGSLLVRQFQGASIQDLRVGDILGGIDQNQMPVQVEERYPAELSDDQKEIRQSKQDFLTDPSLVLAAPISARVANQDLDSIDSSTNTREKNPVISPNIVTFDVEDWTQLAHRKLLGQEIPVTGRVMDNTHRLLALLEEHQVQATFFTLGAVAEAHPQLVRRIHGMGHEIATHGYRHALVKKMGPKQFAEDLRRSIQVLEDIIQEPILGHRAAEFSIDENCSWAWEILAEAGILYDSSIFPIRGRRYGAPSALRYPYVIATPTGPLVELPLATARLGRWNVPVAGGGYLRVLPLGFIQWGIHKLNETGQVATLYFHPYEFDPQRLDLDVSSRSLGHWLTLRYRSWRRNLGRGPGVHRKLATLLAEHTYILAREAAQRVRHALEPEQNPPVSSTKNRAGRPRPSQPNPGRQGNHPPSAREQMPASLS